MARGKTYDSVTRTIGDTPMIRINRLVDSGQATVFAKCEFFQPLNSVKDRIGVAMVEAGEKSGRLTKDSHVIEPTSGNTGIALAFVCAAKGYRLTLTMPESMSLERRALLRAIDSDAVVPPILLIDEVDRADDEFEAYLLEVLSEYQVTVPEIGLYRATTPPLVVLTSNRTRDVHDALKRRCLYHWVEHPDFEREVRIVRLRVPQVAEQLARQVAGAVEAIRGLHLYKPPGVAETIDWAQALAALGATTLDQALVESTLGTVLKYREDQERTRQHGIADLVKQAFERGQQHG